MSQHDDGLCSGRLQFCDKITERVTKRSLPLVSAACDARWDDYYALMAKPRSVIGPDEAAELRRLYKDLSVATTKVNVVLQTLGMELKAFIEADRKVSAIVRRIKEIHGVAGKHWMAI